jgi:PST family polysaccharide transporter
VLAIHIWGQVFSFLGIAKAIWIVAEEYTVAALVITLIGAAINIALNFWLIPLYTEAGSAIATVVSYAIVDYGICLLYPPFKKIGRLMTNALTLKYVVTYVRKLWA